jgi:hypothetical protein
MMIDDRHDKKLLENKLDETVKKINITEKDLREKGNLFTNYKAGETKYKELLNRLEKMSAIRNITDPQEKRDIITTVLDHIKLDSEKKDDKYTHYIEIVFKNPANNITLDDTGLDIDTGINVVTEVLEEIEMEKADTLLKRTSTALRYGKVPA